jgi:ABC-type nitrate/sulfonate/bicarbonate transport system ATPase subunit
LEKVFWCEHLTKRYLGEPVIADVSLELHAGEVAAVLGRSGVGKSTLFNALAGLDPPDEGSVWLRGENISGKTGRVRYMLQKDLLFAHKTVLDNVALPLELGGLAKREARARAASYFAEFGLGGCEKRYPWQLSGGERQRAALLRTSLAGIGDASAPVFLLDEPFSALDAMTRAQIRAWFFELAAKRGWSCILVTHDVDEAREVSDVIYYMEGKPGKLTHA